MSSEAGTREEARLSRLAQTLGEAGLDAFVCTSDESIDYLTGFRPLQLERLFAVVVRGEGGAVVVPQLDAGQLGDAPGRLERVVYTPASDGLAELRSAIGEARRIGVEEDHLVFARARALAAGLDVVPAGEIVLGLRARKDADEIERIRRACELVEAGLSELFSRLQVGDREWEVNARVESRLREQGAADSHPLILFGENAASPHAKPGERELRAGDVVCADLSACLEGYWGDLTRCATAGRPGDWARAAWVVVRDAQAAAIKAARVGTPAREVDLAQRRIVEAAPELGECLHGAGHAIGMAVHEPPFLVPRVAEPLAEGVVLTIEPGIYMRGVGGIRLEDDVAVLADGPRVLSTLPLELVEL